MGFKNIMVGEGNSAKNKRPGDYVFQVVPNPHPHFLIESENNNNLVYNVDVPLNAALNGFKLEIPTLSIDKSNHHNNRIIDVPGVPNISDGQLRMITLPNFTPIGGLTINARVVS